MPVRNTCDCPNPPGGRAECEPGEAAFCIVENGVARQECHKPPTTSSTALLVNWALTRVTGVHHPDDASIDTSDLRMLLAGNIERDTGELVTFALPESVMNAVRNLAVRSDFKSSSGSSSPAQSSS